MPFQAKNPLTLNKHPFLAGADPQSRDALCNRAALKILDPYQLAISTSDTSTDVYFIMDGLLRVHIHGADGDELILSEVGSGEIFGELAAIDGSPRSATITGLTRTTLYTVPADSFLECVLASPPLTLSLLRLLTARIRGNNEKLFEWATLPVRQRLIAELLRLSRPRGDRAGQLVLSPPPPQHVLAARIGSKRETVSRELSALSRAGLLSADRRRIVLLMPEALRRSLSKVN